MTPNLYQNNITSLKKLHNLTGVTAVLLVISDVQKENGDRKSSEERRISYSGRFVILCYRDTKSERERERERDEWGQDLSKA
jgi:hypothetical protein